MKVFGWICSDMFYERIGKIYVSWKIKYKQEVEQKKKDNNDNAYVNDIRRNIASFRINMHHARAKVRPIYGE